MKASARFRPFAARGRLAEAESGSDLEDLDGYLAAIELQGVIHARSAVQEAERALAMTSTLHNGSKVCTMKCRRVQMADSPVLHAQTCAVRSTTYCCSDPPFGPRQSHRQANNHGRYQRAAFVACRLPVRHWTARCYAAV
jgi:hypothetical protein